MMNTISYLQHQNRRLETHPGLAVEALFLHLCVILVFWNNPCIEGMPLGKHGYLSWNGYHGAAFSEKALQPDLATWMSLKRC